MVVNKDWTTYLVDAIIWIVLGALALSCFLPFLHVFSISVSERGPVLAEEVGLWPVGFNTDNYDFVMQDNQFIKSFTVSVKRVILGVLTILLMTVVTAYPLSLDRIRMPGRTAFKVFILIGMLFNGGLIPTFLAYKSLGLVNNFAVLVLPQALNVFFVIIMINFFRGLPHELYDAARIDGASHLQILFRIYVPLAKPALATIALFASIQHWNSWFDGVIYLNQVEDWPLQSWLYTLVVQQRISSQAAFDVGAMIHTTPAGLKAALIFVASVPILMVYPFMQRYFVTGLTLGSVKG